MAKTKYLMKFHSDTGESRQNTRLWYLSVAYEFSSIKTACKPRTAGRGLRLAHYHFAGNFFMEPSGALRICLRVFRSPVSNSIKDCCIHCMKALSAVYTARAETDPRAANQRME